MTRARPLLAMSDAAELGQMIAELQAEVAELQRAAGTRALPRARTRRAANQNIGATTFATLSFDTIDQEAGVDITAGTAPATLGPGWWAVELYVYAGVPIASSSYSRIVIGSRHYDTSFDQGDTLTCDVFALSFVPAGSTAAISAGVYNGTAGSVAFNADLFIIRLGDP